MAPCNYYTCILMNTLTASEMSVMLDLTDHTRPYLSATQVLGNDYILRRVFTTHHQDFAVKRLNIDDLARCARVCRAFSGPALRVLWRKLTSILPVWHLLSPAGLSYPRKASLAQVDEYCAAVSNAHYQPYGLGRSPRDMSADTGRGNISRRCPMGAVSLIYVLCPSVVSKRTHREEYPSPLLPVPQGVP